MSSHSTSMSENSLDQTLKPASDSVSGDEAPFGTGPVPVDRLALTPLLQRVDKPGRYVGGEFGIPDKDPTAARARVVLSYPDTYELGMSNQGLKILYDRVNNSEHYFADRVFLPWPDFGEELQNLGLPLYSLDHFLEVRSFDLWGFNTAHELHYTNLLYALELAGIPLNRRERGAKDPFIITGGTAVSNPLPIFDFMDGVFMGDGEDGLMEMLDVIAEGKAAGRSRAEILRGLSEIEGLVVPEYYEITDAPSPEVFPAYKGPNVTKRNFRAPKFAALEHNLVPNIEITQDRVVVEVARGCGQGCRFCHAGFWKRPVRNTEVSTLVKVAGEMLDKTGNDSISLHSLSIADYPWLEELVVEMANLYGPRGISLSLPSLRVQVKTIPVLAMTQGIRKSNVTFALEAGSELMRERIRKKSSEENLHYLISEIYDRGWDLVKVYFMLGLPDRDGREVDDVIRALNALGDLAQKHGQRKHVNVTVSLFVPKPFTTFQWEEQRGPEYFFEAIHRIKRSMTSKRVHLKYPNPWMAYIEGLLSRSDHRVGEFILRAYNRGARFDSWDDKFNRDAWEPVLEEMPPELKSLWLDRKPGGTDMPWHHIIEAMTLSPEKLKKDFDKFEAVSEENMDPPHRQALSESDFPQELLKPVSVNPALFETKSILEIEYEKTGVFSYVGHLDTARVFRKAGRRARLPMTFSQGYNKHEKFHFAESLPVYFQSLSEVIFVELHEAPDLNAARESLDRNLPAGLKIKALRLHEKMPSRNARAFRFRLDFADENDARAAHAKLAAPVDVLTFEKKERKKKKLRALKRGESGLRTVVKTVGGALANVEPAGKRVEFTLEVPDQGAVSIADLLTRYLELPKDTWNSRVIITRLGAVE